MLIYHPTPKLHRYANLVVHSGPSPLVGWLKAMLRRLLTDPKAAPRPRNRALEAAEARALAQAMRRTDPRSADDLMAAADRHEAEPGR